MQPSKKANGIAANKVNKQESMEEGMKTTRNKANK